jgi:hypothetical protein
MTTVATVAVMMSAASVAAVTVMTAAVAAVAVMAAGVMTGTLAEVAGAMSAGTMAEAAGAMSAGTMAEAAGAMSARTMTHAGTPSHTVTATHPHAATHPVTAAHPHSAAAAAAAGHSPAAATAATGGRLIERNQSNRAHNEGGSGCKHQFVDHGPNSPEQVLRYLSVAGDQQSVHAKERNRLTAQCVAPPSCLCAAANARYDHCWACCIAGCGRNSVVGFDNRLCGLLGGKRAARNEGAADAFSSWRMGPLSPFWRQFLVGECRSDDRMVCTGAL